MAKVVVRGGSECAERAERMNDWARGAMDIAADEATAHQVLEAKVCDRPRVFLRGQELPLAAPLRLALRALVARQLESTRVRPSQLAQPAQ